MAYTRHGTGSPANSENVPAVNAHTRVPREKREMSEDEDEDEEDAHVDETSLSLE